MLKEVGSFGVSEVKVSVEVIKRVKDLVEQQALEGAEMSTKA